MFRFMIIFTSCFMMGKAHWWGTFLEYMIDGSTNVEMLILSLKTGAACNHNLFAGS
jgi:hypothetical protein